MDSTAVLTENAISTKPIRDEHHVSVMGLIRCWLVRGCKQMDLLSCCLPCTKPGVVCAHRGACKRKEVVAWKAVGAKKIIQLFINEEEDED